MEMAIYQTLQYYNEGALMKQTGHAFNIVLLHRMGSELLELVATVVCGCDSISRFIKELDKFEEHQVP